MPHQINRPAAHLAVVLVMLLAAATAGCVRVHLLVDARELDQPVLQLEVESDPLLSLIWEGYLGHDPWQALASELSDRDFQVEQLDSDSAGLAASKRLATLEALPVASEEMLAAIEPLWVMPLDGDDDLRPPLEPLAAPLVVEQRLLFTHYRIDWPITVPSPMPPASWQQDLLNEVSVTLDVLLAEPPHASNADQLLADGAHLRWQLEPGRSQSVQLELRRLQPHPAVIIVPLAVAAMAYLVLRRRLP